MDLLQLRYFVESAKNESFTKTARKYMVPTSSVSASIKRLEDELGIKLFDRKANKIKLNTKGRMFAETLSLAFDQTNAVISEITTAQQPKQEITLLVLSRRGWITDLVIQYQKQHPEISFRMSHNAGITDRSTFDIIIDKQSEQYIGYTHYVLMAEKLCIKAHKDSPFVGRQLTVSHLQNAPFIMMDKTTTMRQVLEKHSMRCNFTPNVVVECEDRHCLLNCVKAGLGLTVGTVSALTDPLELDIVALDVSDFCEIQTICLYHRQYRKNDPAISCFVEFLLKNASEQKQ
ncbi:MAG: LysR family transcriptional regulator [Oscillospiraceae bacterium]|nr:LysR family transcriptional regulator [Oscillospiraceae bacterium]